MGEPSVYCAADDGIWTIWLHPCAIYKDEQWFDSYHVSVLLPKDVPNPWAETKPLTVGISFDSFEAAFAHVCRSDFMVWALTAHAIELSNAVVYWRRRAEDVDPTNKKFRALEYLDDIRCAILDTGWPLGDDSDPELTPVRLVKEILAEDASLRTELTQARADLSQAHGFLAECHKQLDELEGILSDTLAARARAEAEAERLRSAIAETLRLADVYAGVAAHNAEAEPETAGEAWRSPYMATMRELRRALGGAA